MLSLAHSATVRFFIKGTKEMERAILALGLSLFANQASAGFEAWSADVGEDPSSGGKNVEIGYSTSMRSGVFLSCDSSTKILIIKIITGWAYEPSVALISPEVEVMSDGKPVGKYSGRTGAFGDNVAGVIVELTGKNADKIIHAFIASIKQIAFNDGISDRPHLLKARGSTKAGHQLKLCLHGQGQT